jgi:hypothetical protein
MRWNRNKFILFHMLRREEDSQTKLCFEQEKMYLIRIGHRSTRNNSAFKIIKRTCLRFIRILLCLNALSWQKSGVHVFIDRMLSGIFGIMSDPRGQLIPARQMESMLYHFDDGLYRYQVCLDLPNGALNLKIWPEHLTSGGIALGPRMCSFVTFRTN